MTFMKCPASTRMCGAKGTKCLPKNMFTFLSFQFVFKKYFMCMFHCKE